MMPHRWVLVIERVGSRRSGRRTCLIVGSVDDSTMSANLI
jgi:hypothetical protein